MDDRIAGRIEQSVRLWVDYATGYVRLGLNCVKMSEIRGFRVECGSPGASLVIETAWGPLIHAFDRIEDAEDAFNMIAVRFGVGR